jgi:hypothetical protein
MESQSSDSDYYSTEFSNLILLMFTSFFICRAEFIGKLFVKIVVMNGFKVNDKASFI